MKTFQTLQPEREGEAALALDWTPPGARGAPAWLFLHGLGSDRLGEKAARVRDRLTADGHGFAALDFTGHGASGGDEIGLSLSRNLADVGRAVRFVGRAAPASPVSLIGSSMGGIAALWFAARHPDLVSAVFAIAPALEMAARHAAGLATEERDAWRRSGVLRLPIGERTLELGWGVVEDEAGYPTRVLARDLRVPTLLLHGTKDDVVPASLSRGFAARCAAARLHEFPDGDHRLTDHKDALAEIIATWSPPGDRKCFGD